MCCLSYSCTMSAEGRCSKTAWGLVQQHRAAPGRTGKMARLLWGPGSWAAGAAKAKHAAWAWPGSQAYLPAGQSQWLCSASCITAITAQDQPAVDCLGSVLVCIIMDVLVSAFILLKWPGSKKHKTACMRLKARSLLQHILQSTLFRCFTLCAVSMLLLPHWCCQPSTTPLCSAASNPRGTCHLYQRSWVRSLYTSWNAPSLLCTVLCSVLLPVYMWITTSPQLLPAGIQVLQLHS